MNLVFQRRLVGLMTVAVASLLPFACQMNGGGASGEAPGAAEVGTPCTPGAERDPLFIGFRVHEDVIEVNAPECGGGVCLVNHFQGEVSCPLGQATPRDADGQLGCVPELDANGSYVAAQGSCSPGEQCVEAAQVSPACASGDAQADTFCQAIGAGAKCGSDGACECQTDADCPSVTGAPVSCDAATHHCMTYACHKPGDCQQAGATDAENAGKACCVPGTDRPVARSVCGQCEGSGGAAPRGAESAVYCTCRCGAAEGDPEDPDADFCACPDGFECSEIRMNLGLGDQGLTGKYCIKAGTAYDPAANQCGSVDGFAGPGASGEATCAGTATGECLTSGGPCSD